MENPAIVRIIYRFFKSRGLAVSGEASKALVSVLSREEDVEGSLRLILDELKERIEKGDVKSNIVDVETIQSIVVDLSSTEEDIVQEAVQLFDAYHYPKLHFEEKTKSYKVITQPEVHITGNTSSRANMFRERLLLTQQRLLRSDLFTLRGLSSKAKRTHLTNNTHQEELSTIESLLGSTGVKVLFGMLTQPEEGLWFLEDLGSMIQLDLSRAQTYNLFYTEGSIVVVQGELDHQGKFKVQVMGLPPAEDRGFTLRSLNIPDTFGTHFRPQHMIQMQEMETASEDYLVVVLSEIHLDKPLVMEKLMKVLGGFEENGINPLYIMIGSFFSKPLYKMQGGKDMMKLAFNTLADMIVETCPRQSREAKFVFVPGPLDGGSNVAMPRKGIPESLVSSLKQKLAHIAFASNPCKLRCFTQEIVIYREDLLRKMQRHLVMPVSTPGDGSHPEDEDVPDISEQLVESLLDQAHLCPLPLHARPIHWELDHVMRLSPLPHLLILADHTEQFQYSYKACATVNPGLFSGDFSFVVYQPSTKTVQFSRVPE